ncbi:39S ribosomal protein L9, mitochondrial [Cephus cinctus]|uniref:Large ribosomal subunit protein bL9m n=1 Tax=Cephus cinctus TaxID=211228 RepID=A0AAJ7BQE0_CEPCN|nr:39S ribosomal protein L9, mitochondrial [Cephus cinctus]
MLNNSKICVTPLRALASPLLTLISGPLAQQTRNTIILKRKYPMPLHKKGQRPAPLKHKQFIYDVVADTETQKQRKIEIILTSYVSGIGNKGQRINMPSNCAYYNYLLPGLAVYASPENIKKYESFEDDTKQYSSKYVERTINLLSTLKLSVLMTLDNPWTIEKFHIRSSFRKANFHVPDECITMPQKKICGPDLSIENKEFYVTVTINNKEQVKVRCAIHHWSADPAKRLPHCEFFKFHDEAIFPEDQAVLDTLPKHRLVESPSI